MIHRRFVLCAFVLGVSGGAGCAPRLTPIATTAESRNPTRFVSPYRFAPGDKIEITVRGHAEFSGKATVGPTGTFEIPSTRAFIVPLDSEIVGSTPGNAMPYVATTKDIVRAEGLTQTELEQQLERVLTKYIQDPFVNVRPDVYAGKRVIVIGEVKKPGAYPMTDFGMTLQDALVLAGLPTRDAALSRAYIVSPDPNDPTARQVNLDRLVYDGRLDHNPALAPGEIVVIPSTRLSYINYVLSQLLDPLTKSAILAAVYTSL
jgi:protein involved in polysaccharide export with SLBB domain